MPRHLYRTPSFELNRIKICRNIEFHCTTIFDIRVVCKTETRKRQCPKNTVDSNVYHNYEKKKISITSHWYRVE